MVARLSRGGEWTFHGISMRKIEHFRHLHVVRDENVIQGVDERIGHLIWALFVKFGSSPFTRTYALSIFFAGLTLNGFPGIRRACRGQPSCDSSKSPVVMSV